MRDKPQVGDLLRWYDGHARDLPWRVGPAERRAGIRPDPYRVWLSEIMLQQTTVAAVIKYYQRFTDQWPHVEDLAAASDDAVMGAWAGLGYYARARNLLKCARQIANDFSGKFPNTREELLTLSGVGPYTASAIAAIAFDQPEVVVDGNVERVMSRLYAVATPLPAAKPILAMHASDLSPAQRPGDYAQAVMDLGATICTPRNPSCKICPWANCCQAKAADRGADFPRKAPKKTKPMRKGIAYLARRSDGAWLLETRPPKGLLGGMLCWPGGEWTKTRPAETPPLDAIWRDPGGEVRHTFTHFHLRLALRIADVPQDAEPMKGHFVDQVDFNSAKLPTVMRKAFDLASNALCKD